MQDLTGDRPTISIARCALVAEVLERVLGVAQFDIEDKEVARLALTEYRDGRGDFADYVIGHRSRRAGCSITATFDPKLRGSELFAVPSGRLDRHLNSPC